MAGTPIESFGYLILLAFPPLALITEVHLLAPPSAIP